MKNKHKDGQSYMSRLLDLDTVKEIAKKIDRGQSLKSLAAEYGISASTIGRIRDQHSKKTKEKRRYFSKGFKDKVVQEYVNGERVLYLSKKYDIVDKVIYSWIKKSGVKVYRKSYTPERLEEFSELYRQGGKTIADIAKIMDLPSATLYGWSKKLGYSERRLNFLTEKEKNKIKALHERGYPIFDIMNITGCSRSRVKAYIKGLEG